MPPLVRGLISLFIGWPAAWARTAGLGFAYLEGLLILTDREGIRIPFFGLGQLGHPALLTIAFAMSIVGYLLDVLVAYVTAENREALPARTVYVLTAAGVGIQSLCLIAACLLMVAAFRDGSGDHRNWYLAGFGTAAGLGAGFLIFRFRPRIKAWRADLQRRPVAGEAEIG